MASPIRIGIVGYGNLGRGAEAVIKTQPDLALAGIFTRRDPGDLRHETETPVFQLDELETKHGDIDVLILCGGSKSDLPEQTPTLAAHFPVVDSFDTHARIPEHFANVDEVAQASQTVAIISVGWDPGLFSLNRMLGEAILPAGETYTFWGRGLSQGHSDAVRRVPGVAAGVQYTIPSDDAMARVRAGEQPELATREKHDRECYVVLEPGADRERVREAIVTMPDYFEPYRTTVHFISQEELDRDHTGMPHGGFVIRSGTTGKAHRQSIEFSLALDSNPEFTASVLVAYARAAHRLQQQGQYGAKTIFDVPPGLLSPKSGDMLRAELL